MRALGRGYGVAGDGSVAPAPSHRPPRRPGLGYASGSMPLHQIVGAVLVVVGIADAAVGHLFVAPRVPDPTKRLVVKVAFAISGIGISGTGLALFRGFIPV